MAIVSYTNASPTNSSQAIFELKSVLTGSGWTVTQSGDGTTFNGSGDCITDATVLSTGSAWFYVEAPNGQAFTFQNQNNSTGWRIKWRGNGGAVGTGTATQTPSITNEIIIRGSGTDASPGYTSFVPGNGTYRWNVIADNASPYGFWCGAIIFGGGSAPGGMMFDPLTATSPGDVSPYVVLTADGSNNWARSNPQYSILWNDENSKNATSDYYGVYYTASTSTGNPANAISWHPFAPGQNVYLGYSQVVNPITGNDELFPMIWARRAAATGGNPGWKGVSTFSKYKGIGRSTGDTYTVSTTRDRISINDYSLPWDGSVPVL